MQDRNTTLIIVVVVIVVVAAAFLLSTLYSTTATQPGSSDEAAASSTVALFGAELQKVSLLAPDASSTIAADYAPYVDPTLLAQWEADPSTAPGRNVSSPWPDHIQIDSITSQGQGYVVDGEVVLMTSNEVEHGGNAGTIPVVIQLAQQNGAWQIVAYQQQQES